MLFVCDHPLIQTKLSMLRDENTKNKEFRECLDEIASLMTYKLFEDIKTYNHPTKTLRTPTGAVLAKVKLENHIVIAPILRAGLGMVDGIRKMVPTARIGHIGMYRNENTLEPVEYYFKLPVVENPIVIICDPMLATGGSAVAAIDAVKARGYKNIRLMCLVGVQDGIDNVQKHHPDVNIYIAHVDDRLNEVGYILPGLGDAGDRIFGTK